MPTSMCARIYRIDTSKLRQWIANLWSRISHVEQQIGAGLIEEVIQVAEAELKLVDELAKAKV
jgi:hypothetical protein